MAGLVPAISLRLARLCPPGRDRRDKPGDDNRRVHTEAATMSDWSANQYLKFEDERTRPPRDLIAQIPLARAQRVVDMGCGPGNSTELLIARFPDAEVIGLDSSPDMLRQARQRLPSCTFMEGDLTS